MKCPNCNIGTVWRGSRSNINHSTSIWYCDNCDAEWKQEPVTDPLHTERKKAQEHYIRGLAAERGLTTEQLEARITYDLCDYLPLETANILLGMLEAARRVNDYNNIDITEKGG